MSYDDLPRHLKQCFLYCALFPEDQIMYRDDLIRFWVAEGFVEEQDQQLLEDTAEEYFYELIHRNLLQPEPTYFDYSRCKMHDLLKQLVQHLSQDECFCGDPQLLEAKSLSRLRRVSVVSNKDIIMLPNLNKEHIRARTLHFNCSRLQRIGNNFFIKLQHIQVLDLTGSIVLEV